MNSSHDYVVQMLHQARAADLEAAAHRRRLVHEARWAKRTLARLTGTSVLPFGRRPVTRLDGSQEDDSEAA